MIAEVFLLISLIETSKYCMDLVDDSKAEFTLAILSRDKTTLHNFLALNFDVIEVECNLLSFFVA